MRGTGYTDDKPGREQVKHESGQDNWRALRPHGDIFSSYSISRNECLIVQ